MKKLKLNKKIILVILILFLIISVFFNYFRVKSQKKDSFLETKDKTYQTEIKLENQIKENKLKLENNDPKKQKIVTKVEKIASVSEIKDPFQVNEKEKSKSKIKIDSENLLSLEKNIRTKPIKNNKNKHEFEKDNFNKSISILDFKLVGIIKTGNKSSALFLENGKTILKNENDIINSFKIKTIKNKEVILDYQGQKLKLKLWEDTKYGS